MPSHLNQNHLLAALPAADLQILAAQLELVPLALGQMLYEPGSQMRHAYFPTSSIVSLHYVTAVSYTHLDVYKRQTRSLDKKCR